MYEKEILELFNVMIISDDQNRSVDVNNNIVTDFIPSVVQLSILHSQFKPLDIKTLFSVEERKTEDLSTLLYKQILHYIEIYGLESPGLFNLEVTGGKIATLHYIKGFTVSEFSHFIRDKILYVNAPVQNTKALGKIIKHYSIDYNFSTILNNELRISLYRQDLDTFQNGDDAVRWMCYEATGDAMLIKSKKVIESVKQNSNKFSNGFFTKHRNILASVFNRHKRIIIAAKNENNKTAINNITRSSKIMHSPLGQSLAKTLLTEALNGGKYFLNELFKAVSIRDLFKYLNLLSHKKTQQKTDAFVIRNGRVHLENDRKIYDLSTINRIENVVISTLQEKLSHLNGKRILLSKDVDYGLPISMKQTLGRLPFGTKIQPFGTNISSGIYWENKWGAHDLDLSACKIDGSSVGWGRASGYNDDQVTFSGDLTSAPNGAMEFMTSKNTYSDPYVLKVNIYYGELGSEMELIVGSESADTWITNPIVREKHKLESQGNTLGFVKDGAFIVYAVRGNSSRATFSANEREILKRGISEMWTIPDLFNRIGIHYDTENKGVVYDHDLSYESMSYDKLVDMFSE